VWRYLDLGPHVVYVSNVVERTLTEQMREQSRYLRNHGRARQALKEVVEMPDQQADRVLRSIEQNNGELSNALAKQMPILSEPGVWAQVIEVVSQAFQEDLFADSHILDRHHPLRPAGRES
jgi:precorrin-4 methylase